MPKKIPPPNRPPEWSTWVECLQIPDNAETICCQCGRSGDDVVEFMMKKDYTASTFDLDLREMLEVNGGILIPVEPPWLAAGQGELLIVVHPIVACFNCIEKFGLRLDVRSIGDKFVSKL